MGNQIYRQTADQYEAIPDRPTEASKKLFARLVKKVTKNNLLSILEDFRENYAMKEVLDEEAFDEIFSPMLNNTKLFFDFFREGNSVNFYEIIISFIFFVLGMDYDERIQLIFNLFDVDHSGELDKKEMSKLLNLSVYGLAKLAGLPIPPKSLVTEFINIIFITVDEDKSGVIEYAEFKQYIDDNMEVQDFILRYSGVQTFQRANRIFIRENQKWQEFFREIGIEYFGDYFVEYSYLCEALHQRLSHIEPKLRRHLCFIFSYEGQTIVSEPDFLRVMRYWSAFTANDINNDCVLDMRELQMLIWLITEKKPSHAKLMKEINIMDADQNGSLDPIEWTSYLAAPRADHKDLGNRLYYDFTTRDLFFEIDNNGDNALELHELSDFFKLKFQAVYNLLSDEHKAKAEILINDLANAVWVALKKESKKQNIEGTSPDRLTWPEFINYRKVCNLQKAETLSGLQKLLNEVKMFQFHKMTLTVTPKATPQATPLVSPKQPDPALPQQASREQTPVQIEEANDEPRVAQQTDSDPNEVDQSNGAFVKVIQEETLSADQEALGEESKQQE